MVAELNQEQLAERSAEIAITGLLESARGRPTRRVARPEAADQTERHSELMTVLGRIADALEARNAIDGQMAEFAELLQQGAPQVAHEGHPDLAPDGLPRKRR